MLPYNNLNDEELTTLLKQGSEAAHHEVFVRYNKLLFIFAYNKLRDKEEAKDVV